MAHLTGLTKIVWPIDVRYMLPATRAGTSTPLRRILAAALASPVTEIM